jgi:hypothetical protein
MTHHPTGIADVFRKPNLLYIPAHKPRLLEKITALRSYIPTYMRPDNPGVTQSAGGRNRTNRGGLHPRRDHERGTAKTPTVGGAAFHRGAPTLGGLSESFSNFETLGGLSLEVKAIDGDGRAVGRSLQMLCLGCQRYWKRCYRPELRFWSVEEASGEAMNCNNNVGGNSRSRRIPGSH